MMLRVLVVGWAVLLVAIVLNWLAGLAGLLTWYGYLSGSVRARLADYAWLYLVYPGLLGLAAVLVDGLW